MPLVTRILGSRNPRPASGLCPRTGDPCVHDVTPRGCRRAVLDTDHYYAPTGIVRLLRPAPEADRGLVEHRTITATPATRSDSQDGAPDSMSTAPRGIGGRPRRWSR